MKFRISILFLSIISIVILSCGKDRMDKIRVHPLLKKFAPPVQTFRINPSVKNIITGKKGTRLIIPDKAFDLDYDDLKEFDQVTVQLVEVVDSLDFAASGVGLTYSADGKEMQFESAGMYKVTAQYKKDDLELAEKKKIEVQFPNVVPGDKYNMYRMNSSGQWVYDGHNQSLGPDRPKGEKMERETLPKRLRTVYTRIYEITRLTWWNIDYPRRDIACIKGSITLNRGKKFEVFSIGISKKGYFSRWLTGNEFKTIALLYTRIKIVILTEDGRVGVSDIINTGDRWGHFKLKEGPHNYCRDLGEIKVTRLSKQVLRSRKKFLKRIGLKDKKYRVKYPTAKI